MLYAFGAAFLLIFLTEMGDKTQLMAITLASRHDHKVVFLAVSSAVIVATAIGVAAGTLVFSFVPITWVRLSAAVAFVAFGIWTFASREEAEESGTGDARERVFVRGFTLTFVAEMGDKTQLSAIALTASTLAPFEVFFGASLAFLVVTAMGVWLGRWLGKRLDQNLLRLVGGVMFIGIGAYLLLEIFVL